MTDTQGEGRSTDSVEGTLALPKDAQRVARDRVIEWGKQNPDLVQPIERSTLLLLSLIDVIMESDFEWLRSKGVLVDSLEHGRMEVRQWCACKDGWVDETCRRDGFIDCLIDEYLRIVPDTEATGEAS